MHSSITICLAAITISLIVNLLLHKFSRHHFLNPPRNALDYEPQHINKVAVSRLGGVGIIVAILISALINYADNKFLVPLLYSIPILLIGVVEDLYRNLSANKRLLLITFFSSIAATASGVLVNRTGVLGLDWLLTIYGFSIGFSTLAICGLINAYNIIDGLNGLSSLMAFMCLSCVGLISYICHDIELASYSLIFIGAIFGFILLNFPFGKIFLGDCGAYLIGYICAISSILLVIRNPSVSPVFAICINIYPIVETIYSIFRRIFVQKSSFGMPDFLHLHSLIFEHLRLKNTKNSNSKASLIVVLETLAFELTCLVFYQSSAVLLFLLVIYCVLYASKYKKLMSPKKSASLAPFTHIFKK